MNAISSDTASYQRIYERFELIVNGPALFNALVTAFELGLFQLFSRERAVTFERVREHTGLAPEKLRVLLHALCATELVDKVDGRYLNSAVAEALFVSEGEDSWKHILLGWQKIYYPAFTQMTPALRAGTNTALAAHAGSEPTLYQRLAHDPELQATFHAAMAAFTLQSLSGLLEHPELASIRHLLDVGGNDGATAGKLAARYPALRITIFDLPSVTQAAARALPTAASERVRLHAGDLFGDPFPVGADAVLFSHVLEIFAAEQIVGLLRKAFEVLPPGGKLLIYGFHASDDERRGLFSARLSLYLNVLASGQGMAYPVEDYERWLRQAGCGRVRAFTGLPYEHGLLVGYKD